MYFCLSVSHSLDYGGDDGGDDDDVRNVTVIVLVTEDFCSAFINLQKRFTPLHTVRIIKALCKRII